MNSCLFILAVFAVYGCAICLSDEAFESSEAPPAIVGATEIINSIFSQLPCMEPNCGSYDNPEDGGATVEALHPVVEDYGYEPQYLYPQHSDVPSYISEDGVTTESVQPVTEDDDYEPQYPGPQHPDPPIDKADICESINNADTIMEIGHPDIASVKFGVLKELLGLATHLATTMRSEDCHPTVKLLDFIALAAERIKFDYTRLTNKTCVYGEIPVTDDAVL